MEYTIKITTQIIFIKRRLIIDNITHIHTRCTGALGIAVFLAPGAPVGPGLGGIVRG